MFQNAYIHCRALLYNKAITCIKICYFILYVRLHLKEMYVYRKKEGRGREGERERGRVRSTDKSWCVSETCFEGQTLSR